MSQRPIENGLKSATAQYPVVTIMGPQQTGKITVVRKCFPEKAYVNFEEPDTRQRFKTITN